LRPLGRRIPPREVADFETRPDPIGSTLTKFFSDRVEVNKVVHHMIIG
jgi:hypothetical protein